MICFLVCHTISAKRAHPWDKVLASFDCRVFFKFCQSSLTVQTLHNFPHLSKTINFAQLVAKLCPTQKNDETVPSKFIGFFIFRKKC